MIEENEEIETIEENDEAIAEDTEVEEDSSSTAEEPVRYNVTSYGWDTDVEGLVKRLNRQDIYVPHFQRKFVWNKTEKSRFIESLILGLPVPSIFLAVDSDTKRMNIIDGQQRLLTLQGYFSGDFALNAPDLQPELKGCRYKVPDGSKRAKLLQDNDKRVLENSLLHAVVIKQDASEAEDEAGNQQFDDAIIQIFKRLNTTGRALQAQEVRSCIYHGSLNNLLGELNQLPDWRNIFGPEHSRLKDMEAILRFIALFKNGANYKSPMPKFMNHFMKTNRNLPPHEIEHLRDIFISCITLINGTLGKSAFKPTTTFLLSRFDATMIGLANRIEKKDLSPSKMIAAFENILKDKDYKWATEEFVNDSDRVQKRIEIANKFFAEA